MENQAKYVSRKVIATFNLEYYYSTVVNTYVIEMKVI